MGTLHNRLAVLRLDPSFHGPETVPPSSRSLETPGEVPPTLEVLAQSGFRMGLLSPGG